MNVDMCSSFKSTLTGKDILTVRRECDSRNIKNRFVAYFTKEVNTGLATPPLNFNGSLAQITLTVTWSISGIQQVTKTRI